MEDKNLQDLKIDDIESSKKTPLKNILTLLALLFIILVISVVITKLILNTDDGHEIDGNATTTEASAQTEEGTDGKGSLLSTAGAAIAGTGAAIAGTGAAIASGTQNAATSAKNAVHDAASTAKDGVKNAASDIKGARNGAEAVKDGAKHAGSAVTLKERNVSGSKIKVALRDHQPTKAVKELVEEGSSSAKKHSNSTKKDTSTKKSTPTKKATSTKKAASTKTSAQLKNQHQSKSSNTSRKAASDRVVAKKSTTSKRSASDRIVAKKSTKSSTGSIGATVSKLSHGFYIKVGTFKNTETAIKKIKKTGLNYKLVKTKDGKLTRVYIGKFNSKKSAQANLSKAKSVNVGAFIYEEK